MKGLSPSPDSMDKSARIHIPFPAAASMLWGYFRGRVTEQIRSVSFIILYLLAFQMLVLGTTPANGARIALGVGLFVLGLTFFLEGLLLGLMPLGERVGVQLPRKVNVGVIVAFGLLLGVGSTLAEPAIAALREAGRAVTPWDAPLLFRVLEREPERLVDSIGAGVGVAVAFGMIRFYYGFSIKLFIFVLIPLLLLVSLYAGLDQQLVQILGLAWDAGAVTTGAVTVPLVLALGIGVSRSVGKQEGAAAGFGVVMLASAFPVLGVLTLGALLRDSTPLPMAREAFFAEENRAAAVELLGSESAWQAWTTRGANASEAAEPGVSVFSVLVEESGLALRAVIPLTALLLLVLVVLLRDRPRHKDETFLGICFALFGMVLLTSGIRLGLAPLGDEVGRPLPRLFRSVAREEGRVLLEPFDLDSVHTAFTPAGEPVRFFYLNDTRGNPRAVPFEDERWDAASGRYEHILERQPLFSPELTLAGVGLVLLFAFGLGFGSTLAEPALSALGRTVEDLTVGVIKRTGVVRSVSLGVGVGLVIGVARILYDLPMLGLLLPPYLLLLPLTYWSDEDFAAIAWDCGGVTTGSVTVPLVLAMGLGIGGELGVVDGFGVLAMASAYPILTVLLYGLMVRTRRQRHVLALTREEGNA